MRAPAILRVRSKAAARSVLALVAACAALTALAASSERSVAPPRAFEHFSGDAPHVSSLWTRADVPEVARDCRGCHDDSGDVPRDPQAACERCHDTPEARASIAFAPGRETSLERQPGRAFQHREHLVLACRACHRQDDAKRNVTGERGTATCIECHAGSPARASFECLDPRATLSESKRREGFLTKLSDLPRLARPDRGPFRHADHVRDPAKATANECAQCHAEIASSTTADLATKLYAADDCGTCHQDAAGAPLAVSGRVEKRASVACGTFDHRDHLRAAPSANAASNATEAALTALREQRCDACHAWDAEAATYAVRPDRAGYAGCASCHDVPRFRAKEHGRWDACAGCHDFASGGDGVDAPVAKLERPISGRTLFRVPSQSHPGLGSPPTAACSSCHRAPLPATPSRIAGVRFDHAAHLAKAPDAARCDACHVGVSSSGASADVGRVAGTSSAPRRSWSENACAGCHPGIEVVELGAPSVRAVEVPEFSHAAHLAKATALDGSRATCLTCHDADADAAGKSVTTKRGANDCTMCHGHGDEARARRSANVGSETTASCAACHDAGVPARGAKLELEVRVATISGKQHHPASPDCGACHRAPRSEPIPHASIARLEPCPRIHAQGRPSGCEGCHWASVSPSGHPWRGKEKDMRRTLGAELDGFPGRAR